MSRIKIIFNVNNWLLLLAMCGARIMLYSQTDDKFWFVAPEVTADHNDRPIQMRFNTFATAADITVSMPANPSFIPISLSVPPSSLELLDLTEYIDVLENKPIDQVLSAGILIEASTCITAYYEVDAWNNPDIFILKGNNALGTQFFIPFQDQWSNDVFPNPARSGFDLVATEDDTRIVIVPSKNAVNHRANVPFEVTLNRGQTYSVVAESNSRNEKMIGTKVTSDRPIAITIKDDSQLNGDGGTCSDIGGDQLIPIDLIGTQYIVPKGRLNTADQIIIMAVQDNTQIFLNGNSLADYTLDQGGHARVRLTDEVILIESSYPVYVLHASGVNCEIGHAIVPPLECTGSKEISSARVDNGQFFLFIIVPAGHEDDFLVSGVDFQINPALFIDVPGTSSYRVARINANFFPLDVPFRVSNTSAGFHFGILNGDTGARYGYFSDFGSLRVSISDEVICQGDFVDVSVKSTYSILEWSPTMNTSEFNFSLAPMQTTAYRLIASDTELCRDTAMFRIKVNRSYESFDTINACRNDEIIIGNQSINASGFYSVSYLTMDNCDSVKHYQVNLLDTLVTNEVMILCPGESIFVFADQEVSTPGTYFKTFNSARGCDSIHIVDLINDDELLYQDTIYLCAGESLELFGNAVTETGIFRGTFASSRSCDSLQIYTVLPANPYDEYDTVFLCTGTSINLLGEDINTQGIYMAMLTSIQGCDSIQTYTVIEDDPSSYINWPGNLTMNFGKPISWTISDDPTFIDTIIWNTLLGINCILCTDWIFDPYRTTEYEVTITTKGGCIENHRFTVEVIEEKPIYFPNTFSPNGDGINDFFTALTPEPGSIIDWLDIYDRWGNRIFRQTTFQPNDVSIGWDGLNNSEPAMIGVYVYQAQVTFQDGRVFIYTGDITLLR